MEDIFQITNPFLALDLTQIQGEHINNPNITYTIKLIMDYETCFLVEIQVKEHNKKAVNGDLYDWQGLLVTKIDGNKLKPLLNHQEIELSKKDFISLKFNDKMVDVKYKYLDDLQTHLDTNYYSQIRLGV